MSKSHGYDFCNMTLDDVRKIGRIKGESPLHQISANGHTSVAEAAATAIEKARVLTPETPKAGIKGVIRQSQKQPNKTEERFRLNYLEPWKALGEIDRYGEHESLKFAIGNGATLSPDWPAWKDSVLSFYEVKGAYIREDAIIKMKTFARQYPEHALWLYQWTGGEWVIQRVLP